MFELNKYISKHVSKSDQGGEDEYYASDEIPSESQPRKRRKKRGSIGDAPARPKKQVIYKLSQELSDVVGEPLMSRFEVRLSCMGSSDFICTPGSQKGLGLHKGKRSPGR